MDASRICADLVKIHSENPPGRTTDVIEYIRTFFEARGIGSRVTENPGGHDNIITSGGRQPLLFCGHVDVVPALDDGWTYPPFSGTISGGYVWGRGSTDMKGGCAALLAACDAWVRKNEALPADFAFVCDEETGGEYGIQHLLREHQISPCDCVIAEPTPVRSPAIGQKGLLRFEMQFNGSPGHGSVYPFAGVSAIMETMRFLGYVESLHAREYPVSNDLLDIIDHSSRVFEDEFHMQEGSGILRRITFNPGIIHGGEKTNIVAQRCMLDLEMRIPPGCPLGELVSDIENHARTATFRSRTIHEPTVTDPASTLVRRTCSAIRAVHGGEVLPIIQWAASDARYLREAGFRVLEYGPGELSLLHAVNERAGIRGLEDAVRVYTHLMQAYAADKA